VHIGKIVSNGSDGCKVQILHFLPIFGALGFPTNFASPTILIDSKLMHCGNAIVTTSAASASENVDRRIEKN